jgi:Cu(I)/Ag(I) efflux system membrane fusion protein
MMHPPEKKVIQKTAPAAEEETVEKISAPIEFLQQLTPAVKEYLSLKDALVDENSELAGNKVKDLDAALHGVKTDLLDPQARESWKKLFEKMREQMEKIANNKDIQIQRQAFEPLSESFARTIMGFRHAMPQPLFLYHCPMAFDQKGAYWIEDTQEIKNPYFGRKLFNGQDMFKCGTLEETIPPEGPAKASAEKNQEKATVDGQTEKAPESKPDAKDSAKGEQGHNDGTRSRHEGEAK